MASQHTPGPWRDRDANGQYLAGQTEWVADRETEYDEIVQVPILAHDGSTVCLVVSEGSDDTEMEANAHLIAAAPELLAALKAQLAYEAAPSGAKRPSWMELVKVRDAAIAKAEGRS